MDTYPFFAAGGACTASFTHVVFISMMIMLEQAFST